MAFGICKVNSAIGSVPWRLRTSPYPLQGIFSLNSVLSHTCALMGSVLALLDCSWGTMNRLFITKNYRSVKLHTSKVPASLPLLLCLTSWSTIRKLLWFWLSTCLLVQNKQIKAQVHGGGEVWMGSTGSLLSFHLYGVNTYPNVRINITVCSL